MNFMAVRKNYGRVMVRSVSVKTNYEHVMVDSMDGKMIYGHARINYVAVQPLRGDAPTLRREENIELQAKPRDSARRAGSIILFESANALFSLQ